MKLVMGSCRVAEPMKDLDDVVLYPGGHVHSTTEFLHAIGIMSGDLLPPPEINDHMFRGWGRQDEKRVDLDSIDTVVMELCSLKSYRYGQWILHIGYEENVASGELAALEGVDLHRESYAELVRNLDRINAVLGGKRLVLVLQNNIPQLAERYIIGSAAAEWCRQNSHQLIDATAIIAEHGIACCLPVRDGAWDYLHYTDFMKDRMREALSAKTSSGTYVAEVPERVLTEMAAQATRAASKAAGLSRRARVRELVFRLARRIPGAVALVRFVRGVGNHAQAETPDYTD